MVYGPHMEPSDLICSAASYSRGDHASDSVLYCLASLCPLQYLNPITCALKKHGYENRTKMETEYRAEVDRDGRTDPRTKREDQAKEEMGGPRRGGDGRTKKVTRGLSRDRRIEPRWRREDRAKKEMGGSSRDRDEGPSQGDGDMRVEPRRRGAVGGPSRGVAREGEGDGGPSRNVT